MGVQEERRAKGVLTTRTRSLRLGLSRHVIGVEMSS